MIQTAIEYAQMLLNLSVSKEIVKQTSEIFMELPQVRIDFSNPVISIEKKHSVIDKVFPKKIRDFLKLLCDNESFDLLDKIFEAYKDMSEKNTDILYVVISYVTAPDDAQLMKIKDFLSKKFNADIDKMEIKLKEDPELLGGFIIRAGNQEYDWSTRG